MAPPAHPASASLPFEENLQSPSPAAPAPLDAQGSEQKFSWSVLVTYGQASAPRSEGFAEAGSLSVAHDFPLFGVLKWGVEVAPLVLVHQTRVDLPGRPRETVFAVAAVPLLLYDAFPRSKVGFRLEGGAGLLWAFSPVPAEGSRFNFFDLFGVRLRISLSGNAAIAAGVRRSHVSNLGIVGPDNPGLSFYAGTVAFEFAR